MEVEDDTTSNLEQSTATKESLLQNDCIIDNESEKEPARSKSNTLEEGESFIAPPVLELDDSKPFVVAALGENAGEEEGEKKKEVLIHCRNSESAAALSGGSGNSAVESTNVLEDSKEENEDVVKKIERSTDGVVTAVCGGSELMQSAKVGGGGGDGEAAAIERNGGLELVEEKVDNSGEDIDVSGFLVIDKGNGEGDEMVEEGKGEGVMETVKEEEEAEVLKDDGGGDVLSLPVSGHVEGDELTTDVKNDSGLNVHSENVQGVVDADVKNDGGGDVQLENVQGLVDSDVTNYVGLHAQLENVQGVEDEGVRKDGNRGIQLEDVQGVADVDVTDDGCLNVQVGTVQKVEDVDVKNGDEDIQLEDVENVQKVEAVADVQDDFKEEGVAADVKEEVTVSDEKEVVGVGEDVKEEGTRSDEEEIVGVTENEEEEAMLADEEKSVDTEMETEEEATMADEEKVPDEEVEMETESPESSIKGSGGKRKRGGKISKATTKSAAKPRKTVEEDVCFICFDGGDLVLCDRRNCPKAYHPSCVNRDEAFFQSKGRWNCGWHLCSICEKKAEYMCYTCTFSLCKACIKTNVILCVREKEKKGFCEACMKTVMLIEKNEQENQGNVDFDDKTSWEYLFKDYWTEVKAQHNFTLDELVEAKNPSKGLELAGKQDSPVAPSHVKDDGLDLDYVSENVDARKNRRRNAKKRKSSIEEENTSTGAAATGSERTSASNNTEWASKELLEFVMHMRNGDKSAVSQFEVQALLLEYIKTNKLRDSRRKSQIICDPRLESLFGKARVGHFEMLKLLESHFLIKEDSQIDDVQGSVVDNEVSQVDDDETNKTPGKDGKDRKRKVRRKGGGREPQSNREDYAAIDIHNISVIYLRRKLVEDLLNDMDSFHDKVVGTFVRIRIPVANQKQDIYRLVQVTGTSEAAQYMIGKRVTSTMLEILNLNKTESIPIDTISNQEFTEDECKRLRQSIKCGLLNRLTVGDILDKAMELQAARVNDWLETEVLRLSHLRDRASDLGRKKELRECVEKLQVLKTPEERARRLEEFPVIHDDPTMDPNYGSEDDTDSEDKKQEVYKRSDSSRFSTRGRDQFSPRKGDYTSKESWSGTPRSSNKNYEFGRSLSNKNFSNKFEDNIATFETPNETPRDQGRDTLIQQPSILKKPSSDDAASPKEVPAPVVENSPKINESEKMWHYKDPSGKIQGPFSMVQLRKWNNNGYFPVDLKIWRKNEKEDDGMLLTDALAGRFKPIDQVESQNGKNLTPGQSQLRNWTTPVEISKSSPDRRHELANLPSPTPNRSTSGWTGVQPGSTVSPSLYPSGSEGLQSPTPNSAQPASSSIPGASSDTISVAVAPHSAEPGLQSGQFGQQIAAPDNNMGPQMVQPVPGQTPAAGPHGWSNVPNAPPQNPAGQQQLPYAQWGGVPNMVQTPAGNFLPQSAPLEQWGQLAGQPNVQQPPQPWGAMPANPTMGGWVGPTPGNPNMNWGPMVQGPQPTWVMQPQQQQPGWVPGPPVQGVQPNQGWVGPPNGNPNWVGPPGSQGPPNPGWGAPTPNQGPANPNPGWVPPPGTTNMGWVPPPAGNQGVPPGNNNNNQGWGSPTPRNRWGGGEQQNRPYNRDGFSGQKRNRGSQTGGGSNFRGGRRNYNKSESFRKDGGSRDSGRSSDRQPQPEQ